MSVICDWPHRLRANTRKVTSRPSPAAYPRGDWRGGRQGVLHLSRPGRDPSGFQGTSFVSRTVFRDVVFDFASFPLHLARPNHSTRHPGHSTLIFAHSLLYT